MTALPDRGRLGVLPLPTLLLLLARDAFTGRLRLLQDPHERLLEIRSGQPVRVSGGPRAPGICAALVAAGRLEAADARKASALAVQKGIGEEKAILALRLLGAKDLLAALRERARALVLEAFDWPDAAFELQAASGAALTERPSEASLLEDVFLLVQQGLTAYWSPERIVAAIGTPAFRYARTGAEFDAFCARHPLPGLAPLRARLDGNARLADLARECGHPSAFSTAFVLDAGGALAYADAPVTATTDAHGGEEDASAPEIEIVVTGRTKPPGPETAAGPGTAGTAAPTASADALRRTIRDKRESIAKADHYQVLGVPRSADLAAIRRAYVNAAKSFHPDVLLRLGLDDVREEANTVFAALSKAHAVLSDPAARREYDESLGEGGTDEIQRVAAAETLFRKGDVLLRMGSFEEALRFLRPAVELCGDDPVYLEACGWALFKKASAEPDEARALLERAVRLDPSNGQAHGRLGAVLRALGKEDEAEKHLARARAADGKGKRSPAR